MVCLFTLVTMDGSRTIDYRLINQYGFDIFLFTSFWISLYLFVSMLPMSIFGKSAVGISKIDELDVKNRLVASCHGIFICFYCGYEFFFLRQGLSSSTDNPPETICIHTACGESNNVFENRIFCISLSYFIYMTSWQWRMRVYLTGR